jgi:hypothetical protein
MKGGFFDGGGWLKGKCWREIAEGGIVRFQRTERRKTLAASFKEL